MQFVVESLADAVDVWEKARDENGWGASDCPGAWVCEGKTRVAWISYNGRVWEPSHGPTRGAMK